MKMKETNNYNAIGAHARTFTNKVGLPSALKIVHKCMQTPKNNLSLSLGFSSSTKLLLVPKATWKHMQQKKKPPKFKFRFEMGLKLELGFFKLHRIILGIESSSKMLTSTKKERKLKFKFGSKMGPKLEFGFSHAPLNYFWHRKQFENPYNNKKTRAWVWIFQTPSNYFQCQK